MKMYFLAYKGHTPALNQRPRVLSSPSDRMYHGCPSKSLVKSSKFMVMEEISPPPGILERGTYAADYDVPTRGTIILVCHNGLCRKNHRNILILSHFMMRESGWDVRDVAL